MPPLEPTANSPQPTPILKPRTPEQQSFGTIFALVVIVSMIVVGALYAWGKRIAEQNAIIEQANKQNQTY